MRISFFVSRCTPDNSHGRYVIELAQRLGKQHEVTVFAGAFWDPLRSMVNCRVIPVPNRPAVARLAVLWTTCLLYQKRRKRQILHIQGADAPGGNVVTAHCCNAAMFGATGGHVPSIRRLNYSIGRALERNCFTSASTRKVIAVSHQVKADIERYYGVDPKRIVVVPLGVDAEEFHPMNRATLRIPTRRRFGLGERDLIVLFVGGDYRLKGLIPLLHAVKRVPRVTVLAAGVHDTLELQQLIHTHSLANRVRLLGHTNDMRSLYAAADCFVLPTRYDTFSLATLEAMASGLPVIVSRAAGVSELLTSGQDSVLLDDPGDVDCLAGWLKKVAEDETLGTALGVSARRTAERHSWDATTLRTEAVYAAALTSP